MRADSGASYIFRPGVWLPNHYQDTIQQTRENVHIITDTHHTMASTSVPGSQYHHYVPQFLLKSFAHKYRHKKNKPNKHRIRPTELVVNCLELSPPSAAGEPGNAEIVEALVKRTLGQQDMYRDSTRAQLNDPQLVETMLSKLESDTSVVVHQIKEAFDTGKDGICLTRTERNLVRKFLFLLKYRGPVFFNRYNHETEAGYDADDRDRMLAYMRDKGFTRPVDVWLHNIKTIIELDMNTVDDVTWMAELPRKMYPDDANWAMMHMQSMYMAFCRPENMDNSSENNDNEFIITDNCYHIFEGPCNMGYSDGTGVVQKEWLSYHEFAPITPKLMIVLRCNMLRKSVAGKHPIWPPELMADMPESLLADLPIDVPPMNIGAEGNYLPRKDHRFFFPFFTITTDQVDRIHAVLLDNASISFTFVFNSRASFKRTLESYMKRPDWPGKRVFEHEIDTRLPLLRSLATVMKDKLDSDVVPVWDVMDAPTMEQPAPGAAWRNMLEMTRRFLPAILEQLPGNELPDQLRSYSMLGECFMLSISLSLFVFVSYFGRPRLLNIHRWLEAYSFRRPHSSTLYETPAYQD